jgi:signal transduction histidine kinase/DNA-binding NarL/FixJ family response regulator/HPt (histidine-containing phosphotransfer) domain-containing protein
MTKFSMLFAALPALPAALCRTVHGSFHKLLSMPGSAARRLTALLSLMLALCLAGVLLPIENTQAAVILAPDMQRADLSSGKLMLASSDAAPASATGLPAMLAAQQAADKVNLLGGKYWLYTELSNDSSDRAWVLGQRDTLIDRYDIYLYGPDGSRTVLHSGYRAPHDYLLHYGKDLDLIPGARYQVLIHFSSPYYARAPRFSLMRQAEYRGLVARENFQIMGSIGALLALALFNFFIYTLTKDKPSGYYALYVLTYAIAWGLTFHVGTDLFDWHALEWHYVPFFLLPVWSTLFYMHFLRLKHYSPLLKKISLINIVLPLVLLPSCFIALSYAHTLATIVIMVWMVLALICGITVWRRGYQPARFFVLAFVALMAPGLVILPDNLGLIHSVVDNAQLVTLLGGTLDGILLAFAMADSIRLLRNSLEQRVRERTAELTTSNRALTAAKEHAEVVSRHRIDFLSAMSHDIRTPLAGVIGMLRFALRDSAVRGRTEEYLRIGLQNGESLLSILNDILDFSKIDAGKLTVETVDFDLLAVVDDATAILQGQADAKSLLLRRDLALDLPRYVQGDPTRLRQILINLLGNAIKFTSHGEVRLSLRQHSDDSGKRWLDFAVSDTGPGIAAETLPRLFQKFEQADHSTTRRYGGTGLGLAICKELSELMGGSIWVDSVPGNGATFQVSLPLVPGEAPEAGPAQVPRGTRHEWRLRVLCAEDVRTNQLIIGTLLEAMGHEVTIVDSGVEALRALCREHYDLVMMDGRMPLMDGEQATRILRSGGTPEYPVLDPGVTVIALTANVNEHDRARYLALGMDAFLSKPVDEDLLFNTLQDTIDRLLAQGRQLERLQDAAGAPGTAQPGQQSSMPAQPGRPSEDELAAQFGIAAGPHGEAGAMTSSSELVPIHIVPMAGMSPKHLQRITQAFLEEAPRRLALARDALSTGNAGAAAAAFHALKGSAGYLSWQHLHTLCDRMEGLAIAGALDEAIAELPDVSIALDRACADLRASHT